MRAALALLSVLVASPASAQTFGALEDHARHLLYGNPGTAYGAAVDVFHAEPGSPGRLLTAAPYDQVGEAAQAGAVYAFDEPGAADPAVLLGTFFEGGDVAVRRMGRALATGDFDANGFTDIVYGANDRRGVLNIDHGTVFIRWGVTATTGVVQLVASQSDSVGGQMGAALSVADLNDDGIDDLVVGDPRAFPGAWSEESRVLLFHGSTEIGPEVGGDLPPWGPVILAEAGGITGSVVSADADWNCDGRPDLLLGGHSGRLFLLLNPEGDVDTDPGWPTTRAVRSEAHFWVEIAGDLATTVVRPVQVDDLTGDGCADVLVGLPASLDSRGEVMLVHGRSTAEWGPTEAVKELEEVAWIRRRGALPGALAGYDIQTVQWVTEAGTPAKPDLLVTAPTAVAEALDFEPTGRVLFIPAEALFGPPGEPVVKDPPGTLPSDHPRLEDLAAFVLEGRGVDLALGTELALWEDVDNDELPDVVVAATGWKLDPEQATSPEGAIFLIESSTFVDADGDGAAPYEDCDDGDAAVFPGAEELCDGEDNDCNGVPDVGMPGVDTETDQDADGISICDGDCDDAVGTTFPGAEELCNGVDDDCDNRADELWDADGDGYPAAGEPCEALDELGAADCDDTDPAVHPDAGEGPGLADTDCDGVSGWVGGCACATISRPREVAGLAWILLAMWSLALRRRRAE